MTQTGFQFSIVLTSILSSPKSGIKEVSENSPHNLGEITHVHKQCFSEAVLIELGCRNVDLILLELLWNALKFGKLRYLRLPCGMASEWQVCV